MSTNANPNTNVIEIDQVSRYYGEVLAVDNISFNIERGETLGLIGHNGAGKSTLFKMMLGLIPVSAGNIRINNTLLHGIAFRELRRGIGYLPENVVFYDNLTGLETLQFFASLKGCAATECLPLLDKVGLNHAANRLVSGYSKGMRQRLGFAQALLGKPKILFLDEPTNGLDPEAIREFYQILQHLNQQGVTVIITSHILSEIQQRVQRLAVMRNGKLHALGTVQSLRESVDLPLVIQLRWHQQINAGEILRDIPHEYKLINHHSSEIQIQRRWKMELLRRLATQTGIEDVVVHEPTLEDIFLGYAG
ncbi:MAG: Copper transporter ATP-binding protein [Pseudomonadota bacterium]|nr:Copper transporter ATP-binding protein [Pseudomonadota bacterium]